MCVNIVIIIIYFNETQMIISHTYALYEPVVASTR